eukprot:g2856.t1
MKSQSMIKTCPLRKWQEMKKTKGKTHWVRVTSLVTNVFEDKHKQRLAVVQLCASKKKESRVLLRALAAELELKDKSIPRLTILKKIIKECKLNLTDAFYNAFEEIVRKKADEVEAALYKNDRFKALFDVNNEASDTKSMPEATEMYKPHQDDIDKSDAFTDEDKFFAKLFLALCESVKVARSKIRLQPDMITRCVAAIDDETKWDALLKGSYDPCVAVTFRNCDARVGKKAKKKKADKNLLHCVKEWSEPIRPLLAKRCGLGNKSLVAEFMRTNTDALLVPQKILAKLGQCDKSPEHAVYDTACDAAWRDVVGKLQSAETNSRRKKRKTAFVSDDATLLSCSFHDFDAGKSQALAPVTMLFPHQRFVLLCEHKGHDGKKKVAVLADANSDSDMNRYSKDWRHSGFTDYEKTTLSAEAKKGTTRLFATHVCVQLQPKKYVTLRLKSKRAIIIHRKNTREDVGVWKTVVCAAVRFDPVTQHLRVNVSIRACAFGRRITCVGASKECEDESKESEDELEDSAGASKECEDESRECEDESRECAGESTESADASKECESNPIKDKVHERVQKLVKKATHITSKIAEVEKEMEKDRNGRSKRKIRRTLAIFKKRDAKLRHMLLCAEARIKARKRDSNVKRKRSMKFEELSKLLPSALRTERFKRMWDECPRVRIAGCAKNAKRLAKRFKNGRKKGNVGMAYAYSIAADPGIRTMYTMYLPYIDVYLHIGEGAARAWDSDFKRRQERLQSQMADGKCEEKERPRLERQRRAVARTQQKCRKKIHALALEILLAHEHAFVPNTEMWTFKGRRNKKHARLLSFGMFYDRLRTQSQVRDDQCGKGVNWVNEAWTTQTCSRCLCRHGSIGKSKTFVCPSVHCKLRMDRDENAARNIYQFGVSAAWALDKEPKGLSWYYLFITDYTLPAIKAPATTEITFKIRRGAAATVQQVTVTKHADQPLPAVANPVVPTKAARTMTHTMLTWNTEYYFPKGDDMLAIFLANDITTQQVCESEVITFLFQEVKAGWAGTVYGGFQTKVTAFLDGTRAPGISCRAVGGQDYHWVAAPVWDAAPVVMGGIVGTKGITNKNHQILVTVRKATITNRNFYKLTSKSEKGGVMTILQKDSPDVAALVIGVHLETNQRQRASQMKEIFTKALQQVMGPEMYKKTAMAGSKYTFDGTNIDSWAMALRFYFKLGVFWLGDSNFRMKAAMFGGAPQIAQRSGVGYSELLWNLACGHAPTAATIQQQDTNMDAALNPLIGMGFEVNVPWPEIPPSYPFIDMQAHEVTIAANVITAGVEITTRWKSWRDDAVAKAGVCVAGQGTTERVPLATAMAKSLTGAEALKLKSGRTIVNLGWLDRLFMLRGIKTTVVLGSTVQAMIAGGDHLPNMFSVTTTFPAAAAVAAQVGGTELASTNKLFTTMGLTNGGAVAAAPYQGSNDFECGTDGAAAYVAATHRITSDQ